MLRPIPPSSGSSGIGEPDTWLPGPGSLRVLRSIHIDVNMTASVIDRANPTSPWRKATLQTFPDSFQTISTVCHIDISSTMAVKLRYNCEGTRSKEETSRAVRRSSSIPADHRKASNNRILTEARSRVSETSYPWNQLVNPFGESLYSWRNLGCGSLGGNLLRSQFLPSISIDL